MNKNKLFFLTFITLFMPVLMSSAASVHAEKTPLSYEDYAFVLTAYVDAAGMVNYKELKTNRTRLDSFAQSLAQVTPQEFEKWTKEDKIAFWINAYNALTLVAITNNYPIKSSFVTSLVYPKNSIRQIKGVWTELTFSVMGKQITLDEIEHEILRKEFNEPRIHMALVCAAMSCPPLRNEPYQGENLDNQLKDQTIAFLKSSDKFKIEPKTGELHLSSIFKWFGDDFIKSYGGNKEFKNYENTEGTVLNFIAHYLNEKDRSVLISRTYSIKYLDYDWSLNEKQDNKG